MRRRPPFRWPSLRFLTPLLACGALLALCGLPLSWSALTPIPLALALWLMARAETPRSVAASAFWLMSTYFAVQLWWLTRFMADLSGLPWGGVFVLPLFFLEGAFWALMAWLVCRPFSSTLARVWALAAGWVVLEWLRTTGPLAFPWSDLGYTLLPTPLAQTADLWGALGLSLLVAYSAVALVSLALRRYAAPLATLLLWAGGWVYGGSRQQAPGPDRQALVLRSQFDSFSKASGDLTPAEQFQRLSQLSKERLPDELLIWSETAIQYDQFLSQVPAPGIYGVYRNLKENTAQSWDGKMPGSVVYTKLKPVPMGEYFPLSDVARPVYELIFRLLNLHFDPPPKGGSTLPLQLNGVKYGTYICYDSIFSWVPRQMVRNGAQVLVNISNDGWYKGWGVRQHFQMGRLRAIETRRWVLRSVNEGVAASIDDLGRPVRTLDTGEGGLHVTYRALNAQTLYVRLGDWPALVLALCLLIPAVRAERRSGKQLL